MDKRGVGRVAMITLVLFTGLLVFVVTRGGSGSGGSSAVGTVLAPAGASEATEPTNAQTAARALAQQTPQQIETPAIATAAPPTPTPVPPTPIPPTPVPPTPVPPTPIQPTAPPATPLPPTLAAPTPTTPPVEPTVTPLATPTTTITPMPTPTAAINPGAASYPKGPVECVQAPCCWIAPGAADEPAVWCDNNLCSPTQPHDGCPGHGGTSTLPHPTVDPSSPHCLLNRYTSPGFDPNCPGDDTIGQPVPFDPTPYLGLSTEDARTLAASRGFTIRIARVDDEHFMLTMDFVPTRINIELDDGVITRATTG